VLKRKSTMNAKPISQRTGSGCGRVAMLVFGSIFFLAGSFFMWMVVVDPVLKWNDARLWPSTEATILTSKIVEHHDSEGSSFQAQFSYRYEVNGQTYENDEYSFFKVSGSRKGAVKQQQKHPVGSKTVCYYEPQNPGNSVMKRTLGWEMLFGLLPLVFMLVGGGIMYAAYRGWGFNTLAQRQERLRRLKSGSAAKSASLLPGQSETSVAAGELDSADVLDQQFDGPLRLKPENSRLVVLAVLGFMCLFWNGIVSVFVIDLFTDAGGPWARIGLAMFLIPFVLIGLGLIGVFFYSLLAAFNPTVEIALSNGAVPLGGEVEVAWEVTRKSNRIRRLAIHIEGQESATYRRGTDINTDTETFAKIDVVNATSSDDIQFGSKTIRIPENAMHTLDTGNNAIKWTVEVIGSIPFWPDVRESFVFRVKPWMS